MHTALGTREENDIYTVDCECMISSNERVWSEQVCVQIHGLSSIQDI